MKIASVAHVKARLSSYLKASATSPVVATRNGKAVAMLVGINDDEDLERMLLAHSRTLRAILDAADRRLENHLTPSRAWSRVSDTVSASAAGGTRPAPRPLHFGIGPAQPRNGSRRALND